MVRNIIRVTQSKKEAQKISNFINEDMRNRKINREAYVIPVSQSFVRTLTRKGYRVSKRNYGVAMKDIRKVM